MSTVRIATVTFAVTMTLIGYGEYEHRHDFGLLQKFVSLSELEKVLLMPFLRLDGTAEEYEEGERNDEKLLCVHDDKQTLSTVRKCE